MHVYLGLYLPSSAGSTVAFSVPFFIFSLQNDSLVNHTLAILALGEPLSLFLFFLSSLLSYSLLSFSCAVAQSALFDALDVID